MSGGLPAISGPELITLLKKDGWIEKRQANHGVALIKEVSGRTLVTFIPTKSRSLPKGTLDAILSQTKLKRAGLKALIHKYS